MLTYNLSIYVINIYCIYIDISNLCIYTISLFFPRGPSILEGLIDMSVGVESVVQLLTEWRSSSQSVRWKCIQQFEAPWRLQVSSTQDTSQPGPKDNTELLS